MEPKKVTVKELFDGEGQYIIPLFQRHYVWGRTKQWTPLWRDITTQTRKRQEITGRDAGRAKVPKHFTGALVTQQKSKSATEVSAYEIIDGQQRLTTFQIILCAFRGVCREKDGDDFVALAEDAQKLLVNTGIRAKGDGKYKLVPTEFDFAAMEYLVNHEGPIDSNAPHGNNLIGAYNYFHDRIDSFIGNSQDKAFELLTTIREDFGFVEILIESDDEPEVIFESINARGEGLLQFDLLRNFLFLQSKGEERDELYTNFWQHFEGNTTQDHWNSEVKVGRSKIPLTELFLQHFLMAKKATEAVSPLFQKYRDYYDGKKKESPEWQIRDALEELCIHSKKYLPLAVDDSSVVGQNVQIYHDLDITSLRPFFLFLLAEVEISGDTRKRIFHALESYAVRRILCTSQGHKDFNKFFPALIRLLRRGGFTERKLLDLLNGRDADARRESEDRKWPQNQDVYKALGGGWRDKGNGNIIRYVLYRIEHEMRKENRGTENVPLPFDNSLTLEHILPQRWDKKWLLPTANGGEVLFADIYTPELKKSNPDWLWNMPNAGFAGSYEDAYKVAMEREQVLQNIGNLTLLTRSLNAKASNAAFDKKKEELEKNSLLLLSKEVCQEKIWDVAQIKAREERMRDYFCKIWPDADYFLQKCEQSPDGDG